MKKGILAQIKKKETEREEKTKKELGCKLIRINPAAENYIFVDIGKIQNHIIESTKKSLIDDLSTTLLAFKFKSNHSIKSKCLMDCQKHFTKLQKMKNAQSEIKLIKIGTRLETTYCFGCQATKSKNDKQRTQKNVAVLFWPNKSRFLKQKHNNIK